MERQQGQITHKDSSPLNHGLCPTYSTHIMSLHSAVVPQAALGELTDRWACRKTWIPTAYRLLLACPTAGQEGQAPLAGRTICEPCSLWLEKPFPGGN